MVFRNEIDTYKHISHTINESYYSIPRSMRSEVNAVFTAVYDLIEEAGISIKDEEEIPPNNG